MFSYLSLTSLSNLPSFSIITVIVVCLLYFTLLFMIARYGDRKAEKNQSVITANVYALSIAVYCTSWTFLGSVGMAATTGYIFLAIFIGPTFTMFFSIVILKILRISKTYNITSISDFISTRYGKSQSVAILVSSIAVVGIIPYISLQLKAISFSISALIKPNSWIQTNSTALSIKEIKLPELFSPTDPALWLAATLAIFTIIFGTKSSDDVKRHEGLVLAIAFESLLKLIAFISAGVFITFFIFDGPNDLSQQALGLPNSEMFFTIPQASITDWLAFTVLSSFAIIVLPRQFHIMIVENVKESHLSRAIWMFPLYLFLINLFVIPIALGGLIYFNNINISPDIFVISLPLAQGQTLLSLFVFVGCLSAGTAMVIVEAKALSTMISNDLVMPLILRGLWKIKFFRKYQEQDFSKLIIFIRRLAIIAILILGYVYYKIAGESSALVGMGLISFVAVAQFAPAILGGIYWRGANKAGAISGLIGGFIIWFYAALFPSFARAGVFSYDILEHGLFNISILRPNALFGLDYFSEPTHAFFWSMLVNVTLYVGVSILSKASVSENILARQFVGIFQSHRQDQAKKMQARGLVIKGNFSDLYRLMERFLGHRRANSLLLQFAKEQKIDNKSFSLKEILNQPLSLEMIDFVETRLAGAIGQSSAKVLISGVLQKDDLAAEDVMRALDEAVYMRKHNIRLEKKSNAMAIEGEQLRKDNTNLQEKDKLKDDYIATLSHELRTPLTSIRTFSELMLTTDDITEPEQNKFLNVIVGEADRLSRLISKILDVAKIESGEIHWQKSEYHLLDIVDDAVDAMYPVFREKNVKLKISEITGDPIVLVSRDRLLQVIQNLLNNALKFVTSEKGIVNIRIVCDTDEMRIFDLVRLYIEDNGIGIPEDDLENIFLKYHQVENTLHANPKGTGLGLYISRHIIENFGGRLWATNLSDISDLPNPPDNNNIAQSPLTGAVFILTLPVIDN